MCIVLYIETWSATDPPPLCLLLQIPCRLLQAEVALFVCAAGTESDADECRPGAALEEEDRENDAKTEAEGGLDEEVGQAAVPL